MSQEQVALIQTIDDKITRSEGKIERWTTEMNRLLGGEDIRVDNLIDREQVELDKINGPIGIKLGGKSPSEIALSIISQLVSEKYKNKI